ncbi:MAG: enoyl-CoA hydratase/isomerase family protein [Planctomycetota bacterium]
MSDSSEVQFEAKDGVGVITLNRPKANAYDPAFMARLLESVKAADADPAVRVVLIRSALPRFFSGGADVKAFAHNTTDTNRALVLDARAVLAAIEDSGKVFIAVIAGHALGGGLELAMGCDLRFAADGEYQLGLPEVRLGLMPGNGGAVRLPRLVGVSRALDLLVTGASIGPAEAYRIGLVDRLLPVNELEQAAIAYAQALADGPAEAIAAIKRCVYLGADLSFDHALALESECVDTLYDSADAAEGMRAFAEKRPPVFTGQRSLDLTPVSENH